MKQYAVYSEYALVDGVYDNDLMDWFNNYKEAEAWAIEMSGCYNIEIYLYVL